MRRCALCASQGETRETEALRRMERGKQMNNLERGVQMDTEPDGLTSPRGSQYGPQCVERGGDSEGGPQMPPVPVSPDGPASPGTRPRARPVPRSPAPSRHLSQAGGGPGMSRGRLAQVGQWPGAERAAPFNSHWWDRQRLRTSSWGCGRNPRPLQGKFLQNGSPRPTLRAAAECRTRIPISGGSRPPRTRSRQLRPPGMLSSLTAGKRPHLSLPQRPFSNTGQ